MTATLVIGRCVCGHLHQADDDRPCTENCGCSIYELDRGDLGPAHCERLARMTANCLYSWSVGDPIGTRCQ